MDQQPDLTPIVVRDGELELERIRCSLWRLPDGRTGALVRGQVFPLLDGNGVDITGPFATPDECVPAFTLGRPTRGWQLVEGRDEACVLIDGSVIERDGIARRLAQAGVRVLRVGRHLAATDGEDAGLSWFIRVERPTVPPSLDELVQSALGSVAAEPPPDAISVATLRVRLLEAELLVAKAERARLAAECARLRDVAATATAKRSPEDPAQAELERKLLHALAERDAALAALEQGVARGDQQSQKPPQAPSSAVVRLKRELETVLDVLLPRITLLGDSLLFTATELSDRRPLFRALAELQAQATGMPPGWKKVRGATGWWERHLSTGQDDSGRIYARLNRHGSAWLVLVSGKADQSRDLARLDRLATAEG